MKKEFEFILQDGFQYAVGGNTEKASMLMIRAPNYHDIKDVIELHAILNDAMYECGIKASKTIHNEKSEPIKQNDNVVPTDITADDIVVYLLNGRCDTGKVVDIFMSLLVRSCKVDGKQELTQNLVEKISPQTILKLLGEYVVNFPLAG